MSNALIDKTFLRELDLYRHRKVYVRLVSLNFDEDPVAEITGNVTGGSINVDGSSSMRRTCNLTLVTNVVRINDLDWSLRTKFRCYIGLENTVNSKYEDIIWFPQGTFVITSYNSTLNQQGYTINISGKDKMCLLNGEVSGQLFAAHEFSTIYTTHKDGTITKDKIPIYQIIKEAIHTYAQEPYSNIVINDLDTCGVELIDYVSDDAIMYVFEQRINDYDPWTSQIAFEGSYIGQAWEAAIEAHDDLDWDFMMDLNNIHYHLIKKINPRTDINVTAGYRATDLTYPDDLVVAIGGNITQMLDNIIKMLGEFEYFYDVDGKFIFQRKKIYFNSTWTNAITNANETYYDSVANSSASFYDFVSGYLVESFQNKPNLNAIKNDYSVWGKRKTSNGKEQPIHLRYALDVRPHSYYSLTDKRLMVSNASTIEIPKGFQYNSDGTVAVDAIGQPILIYERFSGEYDWRELIYQMARDNLAAHTKIQGLTLALSKGLYHYAFDKIDELTPAYVYNDVEKKFEPSDPNLFDYYVQSNIFLYGEDITKAEWYLTTSDLAQLSYELGYDYQLEGANAKIIELAYDTTLTAEQKEERMHEINQQKEREDVLIAELTAVNTIDDMKREIDAWQDTFNTGYDAYYADMLQFWPLMYRSANKIEFAYDEDGNIVLNEKNQPVYTESTLDQDVWSDYCDNGYWNPDLFYFDWDTKAISFKNPESLLFWIDFAEQDEVPSLWQYSVPVIGRRSKSINDDKVKAIYFRDTPQILFVSEDYEEVQGEENLAYVRINLVPPISNYFRISSQGKSAKEVLDGLLYDGTYYQETITLSTVPVYYLEPNNRITVNDDRTGISGDYLIKSFSLQLTYNGMMSITATRASERII